MNLVHVIKRRKFAWNEIILIGFPLDYVENSIGSMGCLLFFHPKPKVESFFW